LLAVHAGTAEVTSQRMACPQASTSTSCLAIQLWQATVVVLSPNKPSSSSRFGLAPPGQ
jgi:hypothetical protein